MPTLGVVHVLLIADSIGIERSVLAQLKPLMEAAGTEFQLHWKRTIDGGLRQILGAASHGFDLILCWNTRPRKLMGVTGTGTSTPQMHWREERLDELGRLEMCLRMLQHCPDVRFVKIELNPKDIPGDNQFLSGPYKTNDPLNGRFAFEQPDANFAPGLDLGALPIRDYKGFVAINVARWIETKYAKRAAC